MPAAEHATTTAAHTKLKAHVGCPVHPIPNDVKLIIRTRNSEDIVQDQGSFIFTATADVSHNGGNASRIPHFFLAMSTRWFHFGEMNDHIWHAVASPMPPMFLLSTHSSVTLWVMPLITNSLCIPRKMHTRESPSVKKITKDFHLSLHRDQRAISNVLTLSATRNRRRGSHRIEKRSAPQQQVERRIRKEEKRGKKSYSDKEKKK